mgnify:CR=1 FL=1
MKEWQFPIGSELTRDEIAGGIDGEGGVGGQPQGGIITPDDSPNILLFSDSDQAELYGYDYDGWVESNTVFQYTGQGQKGDQEWKRGNKAIRDHKENGKSIRVLIKKGFRSGRTVNHLYIGEFQLDPNWGWFPAQAPDLDGDIRQVFVFRLIPVGEVVLRPEDTSSMPARIKTTFKEIPLVTQSKETEIEKTHKTEFQVSGKETTTGQRKESELRDEYIAHLESMGHEIVGSEITPHSQAKTYKVDLYDKTTEELCEVKSSAVSEKIWHAIGQVLFYAHHLKNEPKTVSILVPSRPSEDLLELITKLGIVCIYKSNNSFERVEPDEYKHT